MDRADFFLRFGNFGLNILLNWLKFRQIEEFWPMGNTSDVLSSREPDRWEEIKAALRCFEVHSQYKVSLFPFKKGIRSYTPCSDGGGIHQ